VRVYTLENLLKTSKYLLNVEDKVSPAVFVGGRDILKLFVDFERTLKKYKRKGFSLVSMEFDPDPIRSVHEPYGKYYIWIHRLKTLRSIKPVS
jgi:hypothetical protein